MVHHQFSEPGHAIPRATVSRPLLAERRRRRTVSDASAAAREAKIEPTGALTGGVTIFNFSLAVRSSRRPVPRIHVTALRGGLPA